MPNYLWLAANNKNDMTEQQLSGTMTTVRKDRLILPCKFTSPLYQVILTSSSTPVCPPPSRASLRNLPSKGARL